MDDNKHSYTLETSKKTLGGLGEIDLFQPSPNDAIPFEEIRVDVHAIFGEHTVSYDREVKGIWSLSKKTDTQTVMLKTKCAQLVITPINSMWKDRAFLRQYYENISFDGQQGTSQDHMAHTQKQGSAGLTLDAQAGQNLGLIKGNAHLEGGAQYTHDASTKARNDNNLSLSFETVPELIAPASSELNDGKAWNIGHPKFGDMSRPQDDNYLHSSYPIAVKNNDVPAFGRLIATKDCDSYGYDVMLRVNLNWLNEGVNGNTDLCARLAQLQQLSGYEQDAVGQWIILQKGRLRVMAAHSEKADPNAMDQTNQRNTFKAEIEEIIQSSEDKSLSALARLIHAQTDMPIDKVFYGVDLQGCLCTEDEIILLNLDPVTHQGATLVTGQEIKEYSRDPAGFEARRAFEVAYQQDLEDWKTGPFDGGIYSDGNTYSAEDAQKAFGKAVEHIKLAFDGAKQTLDLSGNVEERSPLTRLPRSIAHCTAIRDLNLSNTKITSLEPIKNMAGMQILELRGTEIADLGPIADLIRGGLVMTGVDDDRISAIKAATGGDPSAGDPLPRDKG